MKISDEIMSKRRTERLKHIETFMKLGLRYWALNATHNLLTGFFQNSYWHVAWWCFTKAIKNSWSNFESTLFYFWNMRILRLTEDEIGLKIDIACGARPETCEKCGWEGYETQLILEERDEWTDAFCPQCKESIFASLFVSEEEIKDKKNCKCGQ